MRNLYRTLAAFSVTLLVLSCSNDIPLSSDPAGDKPAALSKKPDRAEVTIFQPAGPAGANGVLVEGDFFPPTKGGFSILRRRGDSISYNLHTTGLPPGAYTNWWVIINNPAECGTPGNCNLGDIFPGPGPNVINFDVEPSAFWAAGGIVQSNGVGNFSATISEGEASGGPDGFLFGDGLTDAENAAVIIIIKYHGPASDDPDELFLQTYTLLGLCDDRANAYPLPNGNCFDPQWAIHNP